MKNGIVLLCIFASILLFNSQFLYAQAPTTLNDFFLPGSQPGESGNLEQPGKCDNCHGGYDLAVEPAFNWRGSMMAQAARDPLFYACMAIANQDAPESGDLCIRCHSPAGWLEGRSIPTDGSALNNNDREGVQCDFCHKLVTPDPDTFSGDPDYVAGTYDWDLAYLSSLPTPAPTSANGMYMSDADNAKRGPFVDAEARHQMFYSPFHSEAAICGTCHDVSNPAYVRNEDDTYSPNAFDAPAENFDPYSMFPVERTYSEWINSDYNSPNGVYAPQFGGNKQFVSTCQDCHMRDVTGAGCNKKGTPIRDDLPLHDLTGGNTFIPDLVNILYADEVDAAALAEGKLRARSLLEKAATMEVVTTENSTDITVDVNVINETGHKLPSGYPEGRRIWLNVKALDNVGTIVYESGAYDFATATLAHDADAKIYEIKPGISADLASIVDRPAGVGFHFVLNNEIFKDNRIPPRGFTNAAYETIQSPPVGYTYADGQYWDETQYTIPLETAELVVTLYYQTLSKEYVEFLRDANVTNEWGNTLYTLWSQNGMSEPVVMEQHIETIGGPVDDTEPPTNPTNLEATSVTSDQVDLTWTASSDNVGVIGYNVHRDDGNIFTSTTTTYSDNTVKQRTTYTYYITAFDAAGNISGASNTVTVTVPRKGGKATSNMLTTSGPNPFNPTTRFRYEITSHSHVLIEIYNISGQRVAILVNGEVTEGSYEVTWDASDMPSGTYFVRMQIGNEALYNKVILVK
jgi:hypothetical protein